MEQLINELTLLKLPSTMWGIHIHPKHEFIGILHVNVTPSKLVVDKGLLLVEEEQGVKAKIFLNGSVTYLPNFASDVQLLSDLSGLLHCLHNRKACINSADAVRYPRCLKLADDSNMNNAKEPIPKFSVPGDLPNPIVSDGTNSYNQEVSGTSEGKPKPTCSNCSQDSLSNAIFIVHKDEHKQSKKEEEQPEDSKHTCSICNHDFLSDSILIVHKEEHSKQSKKEESASSPESEEEQIENQQSKEKQGLCNVCGKMFAPGYGIKEHMLTHTQMKPFRCKTCDKSFAKAHNLRMHEYTHTGERPYICSSCGKTYTTRSNLRTHTISCYNEEKKHVCDICRMSFVYPRYLKMHMRTHTGERPFVCSVCGRKFSKNIHLTVHMRTHTGEKPYRCNVCGKGFAAIGGLGYHKKAKHKDDNSL